jgi:hypothetical protein
VICHVRFEARYTLRMVIVLAILLVCTPMFGIYAIIRTEERHILQRPGPDSAPPDIRPAPTCLA